MQVVGNGSGRGFGVLRLARVAWFLAGFVISPLRLVFWRIHHGLVAGSCCGFWFFHRRVIFLLWRRRFVVSWIRLSGRRGLAGCKRFIRWLGCLGFWIGGRRLRFHL
jgi:hypothetical protein